MLSASEAYQLPVSVQAAALLLACSPHSAGCGLSWGSGCLSLQPHGAHSRALQAQHCCQGWRKQSGGGRNGAKHTPKRYLLQQTFGLVLQDDVMP